VSAPDPKELLATASLAARAAGQLLAARFLDERTVELKGGIDLVTDADRAAEESVLGILRDRYPDHSILAEESGASRGSGIRWLVDPLDGTTNYAHQVPHFCVSIAAQSGEGLLAGVVYDPMRDECFEAALGYGATLNGRPLRCSPAKDLHRALLCTGFPYDVREQPDRPVGLFSHLIRRAQGIRRMGSAALDLAYVAAGRFDGFFEFGLKPWDIAAGALLVQEAGGRAARIDGAPLELALGDVLASGAGLFEPLCEQSSLFLREVGWSADARRGGG
jgi:myo-inositol-1(or 4)-monophosphatase